VQCGLLLDYFDHLILLLLQMWNLQRFCVKNAAGRTAVIFFSVLSYCWENCVTVTSTDHWHQTELSIHCYSQSTCKTML